MLLRHLEAWLSIWHHMDIHPIMFLLVLMVYYADDSMRFCTLIKTDVYLASAKMDSVHITAICS